MILSNMQQQFAPLSCKGEYLARGSFDDECVREELKSNEFAQSIPEIKRAKWFGLRDPSTNVIWTKISFSSTLYLYFIYPIYSLCMLLSMTQQSLWEWRFSI